MPKVFFVFVFLLLDPGASWALQTHRAPEGLYVHQMAHLFLAFTMAAFAYRIRSFRLHRSPNWAKMMYMALVFVFWNLWAFSGHVFEELLPEDLFIGPQTDPKHLLILKDSLAYLYFITRWDNLFLVIIFWLFYRGLDGMAQKIRSEARP
ncbi:hypothetical protein [Thermosulfuriphilus sp.]